jgi:hypothetical protein
MVELLSEEELTEVESKLNSGWNSGQAAKMSNGFNFIKRLFLQN